MAQHAAVYELTASRTASGGSVRVDSTYLHLAGIFATADEIRTPPIGMPSPVPYSGYTGDHPGRRFRVQVITDDAGDLLVLEGQKGDQFWQANGVATDNGGDISAAIPTSASVASGRITPDVYLNFGADVTALIAALTGSLTGYNVTVDSQYGAFYLYQGQAHICDFEEVPPSTALISNRAQDILNQLNSGGAVAALGTLVNGTVISVKNCVYAGLAPEGAVYIDPSDIGNANNQIPTSVLNNTAERFRFHPSVFVRRGPYWNSVIRRCYDGETVSAEEQGMPIKIVQVDNPLTQSAWMVGIDGVMSPVYVQHPNGSDYRRPHDIWTNVWLPIINGSTSVQDAVKVGVGANITDVGDMTRFQYLEYARCLPLPGTPTTQTDTIAQ